MIRRNFLARILAATVFGKFIKVYDDDRKPYTATDVLRDIEDSNRRWKKTWFVDQKNGKITNNGLSFENPITMSEAINRCSRSGDVIFMSKSK